MLNFFGYDRCGTCRKAKKFLEAKNIAFKDIDITTKPPSKKQLKDILNTGDYELKHLFNTSGVQYRELNIKDKLPKMTEAQALDMLSKNGRLVKRPIVTDGKRMTVGFKEDLFKKIWK